MDRQIDRGIDRQTDKQTKYNIIASFRIPSIVAPSDKSVDCSGVMYANTLSKITGISKSPQHNFLLSEENL